MMNDVSANTGLYHIYFHENSDIIYYSDIKLWYVADIILP